MVICQHRSVTRRRGVSEIDRRGIQARKGVQQVQDPNEYVYDHQTRLLAELCSPLCWGFQSRSQLLCPVWRYEHRLLVHGSDHCPARRRVSVFIHNKEIY
ncbi:predicted protein [Plenodomus lingam JN3]|uniref:Predicted protein n=1 Tax=Leptosphaeria maculans (strain JN3 / isolate v23.1.3 / race Av1-4-5-6-7-8) TaxID=985895 RepID=E4ZU29_LEPMJ|nr:predicted protein [Plenodomus lingam JN3]CBX94739.1 predicted protein [Plenodomus lingam JN3]